MTLHPDPEKVGVNIDEIKYKTVKNALLKVLTSHQNLAFGDLVSKSKELLADFEGSKGWYITTVKLDLEARGLISVDRNITPQRINLVS